MNRPVSMLCLCAVLAGCSGGGSGLNPMRWFGGGAPKKPQSLEPKGGYRTVDDKRLPVPQILSARWEPTTEGRLLVVTAIAPTKGWWNVEMITQTPQPTGRTRPDADGILRLRLVGLPPPPGSPAAREIARPETDMLTVAFPISNAALATMDQVTVSAANNAVSLKV
ncbi:hypothetical protein [Paracoccus contaminans]|uniref:Lipoprotein n=1 Tax=Paracoccus contaminans TaxID=1945662 RepID=A0A1W6CUN4_9RHOB|nr:hypothetical protein [Paracoccus contaminans]ARJ68545.1 hypothetical protein B0A89_01685 [Paracoccus contaminans]